MPEAAIRIGKSSQALEAWEQGRAHPTYHQLEALAEHVYRRPVALFFLPEPPVEEPVRRQFRTLPDAEIETLSPDTRFALRDATAFQKSLRELTGNRNPAPRLITRDVRATLDSDLPQLARRTREYLDIDLKQQRSWSNAREAVDRWRDAIENAGVFVFKRSFKQREISGFCIFDQEFPIIVANNSTAFTRQVFTLIHELAHLLFGVSSITKEDARFLDRLAGDNRTLEIACNEFAAEFLMPADSFPWTAFAERDLDEAIAEVADSYHVSREVVLRRLLDGSVVDRSTYAAKARQWALQAQARTEGEGGNYYATQAAYLGRAFLNLAFGQYRAGKVSLPELAEHLRIKAKNIGKLEDFLGARG